MTCLSSQVLMIMTSTVCVYCISCVSDCEPLFCTHNTVQAAYDKWLKANHAARRRHNELDIKRRKLKESKLTAVYTSCENEVIHSV